MGDSGYMVLRKVENKWECIFRSEDLVHAFNYPRQVGTLGDDPKTAHCESHVLLADDLIVLATDGLWDNVWEQDVLAMVEGCAKTPGMGVERHLDAIASELANAALRNSVNWYALGP